MNLGLKKVLDIPQSVWKAIGQHSKDWIRADALKGVMQDGQSGLQYRSETYKKYKANSMRKFGRGKNKVGKDERLKSIKGLHTNNKVSFVNLTLTGKTLKSTQHKADDKGVNVYWAGESAGIVDGVKGYGYNIVGLNDKNIKKAKEQIIARLDKNVQAWARKKLVINIGK